MRNRSIAIVLAVAVVLLGWVIFRTDGSSIEGEARGVRQEADLVPGVPRDIRTSPDGDRVLMRFTSALINIGDGDFVLHASRTGDDWVVEELVPYSEGGSLSVPVDIAMAWGGDGHEHWHVDRVAVHWLEAIDDSGEPNPGFEPLPDTKVGFCFFDSNSRTEEVHGDDPTYLSEGCGELNSARLEMGLSVGWSDVYDFTLPGQSIDITDVPDGRYRLWVEVDQNGWFREITTDNNITWVDIDIGTNDDGGRSAGVVEKGPEYAPEFFDF